MTHQPPRRVTRSLSGEASPSTATVLAVADAVGTDPTELPPLASTVDPDALDALVASADVDARLSFTYDGLRVTIRGDEVAVETTGRSGVEQDALG